MKEIERYTDLNSSCMNMVSLLIWYRIGLYIYTLQCLLDLHV